MKLFRTGFDWTNRRRWIFGTTAFCMLVVAYCLYTGSDARIYETALNASFMLLGSVGGSYIFGAAWEHKQIAASKATDPNA